MSTNIKIVWWIASLFVIAQVVAYVFLRLGAANKLIDDSIPFSQWIFLFLYALVIGIVTLPPFQSKIAQRFGGKLYAFIIIILILSANMAINLLT